MSDGGPTAKTATLEEGVLDENVEHVAPISLVMYHRGAAYVVPLLEGVPVVVGRAEPSDLTLDDRNLSRTHARFTLRADGVWIEDERRRPYTPCQARQEARGFRCVATGRNVSTRRDSGHEKPTR